MDRICLALVAIDGSSVEVNEKMDGWQQLIESLPQHLPGCKPWHDWFIQVAFPAFAENKPVVFERNVASEVSKSGKIE